MSGEIAQVQQTSSGNTTPLKAHYAESHNTEMPKNWEITKIDEVCILENGDRGANYPSPNSFVSIGIPFVNAGHLESNIISSKKMDYITKEAFERISGGKFKPNDILFCLRGSLGKFGIVGDYINHGAIASSLVIVRPNGKYVSTDYLGEYFNSELCSRQIEKWAGGAAQPNLGASDLKKFLIPLPPRPEQQAITTVLSDLGGLIIMLERLIAKKQAIRQGMMQQLLTGKTRLPGFTKPWCDVRLGDHVTYVKTVALSRAQLDTTSPLRYLHYGDIHTRSSVRLEAATESMPRVDRHMTGSAGRLQIGDLVFADASEDPAGVGKSIEITSVPLAGVVPGLHTIAARFDKETLADGFKAYLQFTPTFRNSLLRLAAGTKVLATTRAYISSITLSLPDIEEQLAIAKTIIDCDTQIEVLEIRLNKTIAVKRGMMQELLTGRTRLPVAEAVP